MVSYISRRKRWWLKLKELDPKIDVSETLLADYLLICARISDADLKLCKSTCKGEDKTVDKIAAHLKTNHSNLHQSETSRHPKEDQRNSSFKDRNRPHRSGPPQRHRYTYRKTSFRAHAAEDADYEDQKEDDDYSSDQEQQTDEEHMDQDNIAFLCHSCGPDNDFEDYEVRIEQDIVCAFMSASANLDDPDVCQEVADAVHSACTAFAAYDKSHQRGIPMTRRLHPFSPPASELTLRQRREGVDKAKANSECYRCLG